MLIRRTALAFGFLALVAGCSDNSGNTGPAPQPADAPGPHFLQWAGPTAPQFTAVGVDVHPDGRRAGALPRRRPGGGTGGESAAAARRRYRSLSWSHTVGSGVNRLLVVSASIRNAGKVVTGATSQGESLTLVARNNPDAASGSSSGT